MYDVGMLEDSTFSEKVGAIDRLTSPPALVAVGHDGGGIVDPYPVRAGGGARVHGGLRKLCINVK